MSGLPRYDDGGSAPLGAARRGARGITPFLRAAGGGGIGIGEDGYDSAAFGEAFGADVALGGMFANGEIGPVGAAAIGGDAARGGGALDRARRATHLHEFTTVFAVLCSLDDDDGDSDGGGDAIGGAAEAAAGAPR